MLSKYFIAGFNAETAALEATESRIGSFILSHARKSIRGVIRAVAEVFCRCPNRAAPSSCPKQYWRQRSESAFGRLISHVINHRREFDL